jgi:hypothetical protein
VAAGILPHEELGTGYPLAGMLEDMRKYVRAGIDVLSSQGTDELAGAFLSRAQAFAEQLSSLAAGFREWSAEARASLLAEVKQVVAGQVKEMGLATKKDLEALRARVERLEHTPATGAGRAAAKPNAGRAAAKPNAGRGVAKASAGRAAAKPNAGRAQRRGTSSRTSTAGAARTSSSSRTRRTTGSSGAARSSVGGKASPAGGTGRGRRRSATA